MGVSSPPPPPFPLSRPQGSCTLRRFPHTEQEEEGRVSQTKKKKKKTTQRRKCFFFLSFFFLRRRLHLCVCVWGSFPIPSLFSQVDMFYLWRVFLPSSFVVVLLFLPVASSSPSTLAVFHLFLLSFTLSRGAPFPSSSSSSFINTHLFAVRGR